MQFQDALSGGPGDFTITVVPRNDIPFEYMVSLANEDGESVSDQFQVVWKRVFPNQPNEPMKWKLAHDKVDTGMIIVLKVTYREITGPFSAVVTQRYQLLQYGVPEFVDESRGSILAKTPISIGCEVCECDSARRYR